MGCIFLVVPHLSRCAAFFQVWPICPSVTHFSSVIHFSKCDLFFQVWPIFPGVAHFSRCGPFFQVWLIFPSVTHFTKGDSFYHCDTFFQVRPIFIIVTILFFKWDPVFQVSLIFLSVTFVQMWPFFPSVTHFSNVCLFTKCDPFLSLRLFFSLSVTHFYNFDPFFQVWLIFF